MTMPLVLRRTSSINQEHEGHHIPLTFRVRSRGEKGGSTEDASVSG